MNNKIKINRTRERVLRVRVSDAEFERCAEHSRDLGYRSIADWLRECASRSLRAAGLGELPQHRVGAPLLNQNRRGKPGKK